MVQRYALTFSNINLEIVDIAPRWRAVHDQSLLRRVLGGTIQTFRDSWRLFGALRKVRPHVIHLTSSGQLAILRDLAVMLLSWIYSTPVIYHIRFGRVPEIAKKSTCEWLLMRLAISRADSVIAIDSSTVDAINEYLPQVKVEHVPNCVNFLSLPEITATEHSVRRVVFIGWVIPSKGIEELISAWSQLGLLSWQLDIIGPGDQNYIDMLNDKYESASVVFHGELDHGVAMVHLSDSDLFVLPSYTEGFPNVVLEAMALGKPIVATSVGAISEMLEGGSGILVKPRSVFELKKAIRLVTGDEKLRDTMGARAREKAKKEYTIEVVFEKYINIWWQSARRGQ
jgi:glycosyltransferase involved in cell wall biosynthesis